jgi:hypothetical protein
MPDDAPAPQGGEEAIPPSLAKLQPLRRAMEIIVNASPLVVIPPVPELPAPDWRARLAELREKFAECGHLSVPTRRFGEANRFRRDGTRHAWREEDAITGELLRVGEGWLASFWPKWNQDSLNSYCEGTGSTPRAAYHEACRQQRLAKYDTARLLHERASLVWTSGQIACQAIRLMDRNDRLARLADGRRAQITSLKHQLANSEQVAEFAADLLNKAKKADPKAMPRATNDTRKLRKQIDLARSFLCAAGVPPLPLEDQCKWIGGTLVKERDARVQAEGKLQAAELALDDLVKAAGSPAAN